MPLTRTLAALSAATALVLSLAAASPAPVPVASLPSAAATDPDYPYLWPEGGSHQPRAVRPGDYVLISTNDGVAHPDDTVRSPAFTEPVTLHDAKSNYVTTAQIRCDAEAGDYPVHLLGEGRDSRTWAKVRVHGTTTPTAACAHPSPYTTEELWPMLSPVQPVRPGERAHFALGVNAALAVGDGITSPALDATYGLRESAPRTREEAQQPTLEQLTHSATADATVRCGTKPGLYPVHFHFNGSDGGQDYRFEVQLTVLPETGKPGSMCGR